MKKKPPGGGCRNSIEGFAKRFFCPISAFREIKILIKTTECTLHKVPDLNLELGPI
jgi:hypothetical protein